MAKGSLEQRFSIPYWDGVNSIVQPTLQKKTELSHMENARAPIIGVLEKRQGQVKIDSSFPAEANYGLVKFKNTSGDQGIFRIAETQEAKLFFSVNDSIATQDIFTTTDFNIHVFLISDTATTEEWISFVPPFPLNAGEFSWFGSGAFSGQNDFTNAANAAYPEDGVFATATDTVGGAMMQSFDYNSTLQNRVPTGSTVTGIKVRVVGKVSAGTPNFQVYLTKGDVFVGTTYKETTLDTNNIVHEFGGQNDLWGTTWVKTDSLSTSDFAAFHVSIATSGQSTAGYSIDAVSVDVFYTLRVSPDYTINVVDNITVSDPNLLDKTRDGVIAFSPSMRGFSDMYRLLTTDTWEKLEDTGGKQMVNGDYDFANVSEKLVFVNGADVNRMLDSDGVSVTTSGEAGSLYGTPNAKKVAFYKNRIYLGDFSVEGIEYKTTILRSSFPMGIVALVVGDVATSTTIPVTDTKYFYSDTGMNTYDVYRGITKITTLTVTTVNETSITVSSNATLSSSDEIWVAGTFDGEKQYRWINNSTSIGQTVKQYDTFKLSGGDEDEITVLETIGNILFIANKNTMMTWNDYSLQNFDMGIGCYSKTGYTKLMGSMYFIHSTGIYTTGGALPTLVSRKVERYIRGATTAGLENSSAGFKENSVFFAIGDVTLYNPDGSLDKIMPDVCLEYATLDKNWYVHTNVPSNRFVNFINSAGTERLLIEHAGGGKYIKEFLSGNTDDGGEIFFRVDTVEIPFTNEFELYSNPTRIVSQVDRGSSMKSFIKLDDNDFYEIPGEMQKGISKINIQSKDNTQDKKNNSPMCRTAMLSFRDDSKQLCRLMQVALMYTPTTVEENT